MRPVPSSAFRTKLSRALPADAVPSAIVLALVVALPCLAIGTVAPDSVVTTTTTFLVMLTGVMALSVFTGNSGILSFGHVGFMAIAAQVSATMTVAPQLKQMLLTSLPAVLQEAQWGFWPALGLALLVIAVVAWLAGLAICRLPVASMPIATLGLLIIVHSLMIAASGITRGNQAMHSIPKFATLGVMCGLAAIAIVIARLYRDSVPGLLLRSSRENEAAARSIGIDVEHQRMLAWIVSAILAGVAGAAFAHHLTVFTPRTFYFDLTFAMIVMLVVGGMSSVTGAIAGAVGVTLVIEFVRRFENGFTVGSIAVPNFFGLTQICLGLIIIYVLYRRQQGLIGYDEIDHLVPRLRSASAGKAAPSALPATVSAPARVEPATLEVRDVSKAYGGLLAVDKVSFTLRTGEVLGLIGPNGSGKTTLIGCIAGTHAATDGQVLLAGAEITGFAPHRIARLGLGRTFQTVRLFSQMTVLENVMAAVATRRADLARPDIARLALSLLDGLGSADLAERKAGTLAYGQQRRVEIARALALEPRFLLLDEPAAGMNETETTALLETLRELVTARSIGLLIVDHDMHLIMRLCDRLVVLNKGQRIAEGSPGEIQSDPAVLAAYLGSRRTERDEVRKT